MEGEDVRVGGGGGNPIRLEKSLSPKDRLVLRRQTLEAVLDQCRRTLELLSTTGCVDDDKEDDDDAAVDGGGEAGGVLEEIGEGSSTAACRDCEADEFCDLLKSRVECPDFLQKLECAQASIPQSRTEEGNSWDVVSENDLWESGNTDRENDDYVVVRQEDIVDGIACFMAAYLLSLEQTKDLTPKQIQDALGKTFSLKKKKGKLRKAWDGSKVIYNVASWGATAIGIYQNPALVSAASAAFWSSYRVISKFL